MDAVTKAPTSTTTDDTASVTDGERPAGAYISDTDDTDDQTDRPPAGAGGKDAQGLPGALHPAVVSGGLRSPGPRVAVPPVVVPQTDEWLRSVRRLFYCLSVCLSVCLPICLSVCLSICLSVCLSVCLSFFLINILSFFLLCVFHSLSLN